MNTLNWILLGLLMLCLLVSGWTIYYVYAKAKTLDGLYGIINSANGEGNFLIDVLPDKKQFN